MTRGGKPDTYSDLAYNILKKTGTPMHYMDIIKEILKVKKTEGKTPHQTLKTVLSRDDRFIRVGRGTYGLRK